MSYTSQQRVHIVDDSTRPINRILILRSVYSPFRRGSILRLPYATAIYVRGMIHFRMSTIRRREKVHIWTENNRSGGSRHSGLVK